MTTQTPERWFPIQAQPSTQRWRRQFVEGPRRIPWARAAEAYVSYSYLYGTQQSLERLAERGGFGWFEFLALHSATRMMAAHRERTHRMPDPKMVRDRVYAYFDVVHES